MWETGKDKKEKAILVTVEIAGQHGWDAQDSAGELKELVYSSGTLPVKEIFCRRHNPTPAYFIGRGKSEEIADFARDLAADVVIFNEDLSSTQQRNLEETINIKTIDRTQLILDIFAQRAKSREGKIQVELAQLEYLLPRLTGQGVILSRLGGGIGTRGPGEKKLEVDRRRIRKRIAKLKNELSSLTQRRKSLHQYRQRQAFFTIAIIGYTNAGKSTLLNRLTGAKQIAKNSLFTTLDPAARGLTLADRQKVLFSDTVGFLHRLPHHLIEAFKATLEEVIEADVLLHVLDISSPLIYQQSEAVEQVLQELQVGHKPMVFALNKLDLLDNEYSLKRYLKDFANSVAISALKGTNIEQLLALLNRQIGDTLTEEELFIPQQKLHLLNMIHQEGQVLAQDYQETGLTLRVRLSLKVKSRLVSLLQEQDN